MIRALTMIVLCAALAGCGTGGRLSTGAGSSSVPGTGSVAGPGEVMLNCSGGLRGTEVARFPTVGRAKWRIIDTAPGSTEPRTQYVTGFGDGCARQVTAALVVFGAPDVHETLRYDPANDARYSATDTAYERIKGRVCRVGARTRCPADRMVRLAARTAFVTIYPRFGGTAAQVELLLDNGALVAQVAQGI